MRLGFGEIVTVLALAMLLFGPSRLPALGASLGEAIRGFKRGLSSRSLSGWNFASLRADDHARLGAAARAAPSAGPRPEQTQTRTSKAVAAAIRSGVVPRLAPDVFVLGERAPYSPSRAILANRRSPGR